MATQHTTSSVLSEASDLSDFMLRPVVETRAGQEYRYQPIVDYISVRVTVAHIDVSAMLEKVFAKYSCTYICYLHKGSKTQKEHVHILLPIVNDAKKIKDRLRLAGYKGNEY